MPALYNRDSQDKLLDCHELLMGYGLLDEGF